MALPEAVRKQEEEGLKKAAEMYKKPEGEKDDGTPVAPAPNLDDPAAKKDTPPEPPKEDPVVPVIDKKDDSSDWKARAEKAEHQLSIMNGKYDAEVPRLTLENKHLRGEMDGLKAEFTTFKKSAENNVTAKKDAEEQKTLSHALGILDKELGSEAVEAIKNLIGANTPKQDLSSVNERMDKQDERMDNLGSSVEQLSEGDCQAEMTRLCPDWTKLNNSREFKDWLKEKDDITGYSYFDLLSSAYGEKNPVKSVAIFNRYKASLPAAPKKDEKKLEKQRQLDELTAPGKGSSSDSTPKTEPKIYTRKEIDQFNNDVARGKYKGKEDMVAKIDTDIAKAYNDGRISA